MVVVDSGVAAELLGHDAGSLRRPTAPIGGLLEGFVMSEIARQLTWSVGIVLYTGQQTLPFGPKFRAVPIAALWEMGG